MEPWETGSDYDVRFYVITTPDQKYDDARVTRRTASLTQTGRQKHVRLVGFRGRHTRKDRYIHALIRAHTHTHTHSNTHTLTSLVCASIETDQEATRETG